MAWRAWWAGLTAAALMLTAVPVRGQSSGPTLSAPPPPPGRLIDLGGYRLHLYCTGSGSPIVVLSAGAGDFSFDWALVQPAIARTTRVCAYDRGGEAWSELGPRPRSATQEAFDLHRLLLAAGERGPYVLVGHSYGGNVVRFFTMQHAEDVAGIVLVDAMLPQAPVNLNGKVAPAVAFSKGRPIPAPRTSVTPEDGLTPEAERQITDAIQKFDLRPSLDPPFEKLPPDAQKLHLWALGRHEHFLAGDPDYVGEEAVRIDEENHRALPLGDRPLLVLIRDTTVDRSHDPLHVRHQQAMAGLSSRGEYRIVPGAGHHIQVDRPDAVIDAVRKVVREIRERP